MKLTLFYPPMALTQQLFCETVPLKENKERMKAKTRKTPKKVIKNVDPNKR